MKILPTIIAGGGGTRLWPLSKPGHPKPLLPLADGRSLLHHTAQRMLTLNPENLLIVCGRQHHPQFVSAIRADSHARQATLSFIQEPEGRNTAAAVAAAAVWARRVWGGEAILVLSPSDHFVPDHAAFTQSCLTAIERAREGKLALLGITPTRPETGYGYILTEPTPEETQGKPVVQFLEKPALGVATDLLRRGIAYWNSGIFIASARTLIDLFAVHAPDIHEAVEYAMEGRADFQGCAGMREESFRTIRSVSFDKAVLEKASDLVVVPTTFAWSDLGTWESMADAFDGDREGNTTSGSVALSECESCLVQSNSRPVAVLGLKDTVVIETADAVLVTHKNASQDVGMIARQLAALRSNSSGAGGGADPNRRLPEPTAQSRPWGSWEVLDTQPGYKLKRINVLPGQALSLQMHHHRSEHWVVASGKATVTLGAREFLLFASQSIFIPQGSKHRLENAGTAMLVVIEVQCGLHCEEDDIVRFEDRYGREVAQGDDSNSRTVRMPALAFAEAVA